MARLARWIYLAAAWLFLAGVAVQVYLAGMVVVAGQMGWGAHAGLGHILLLPLLLMLIAMYAGRMPGSLKLITWLLVAVYILQADVVIFLRGAAPAVAALHPVLALFDFALGATLAWRAWPLVRQAGAPAEARGDLGTTTHP